LLHSVTVSDTVTAVAVVVAFVVVVVVVIVVVSGHVGKNILHATGKTPD
jgi:hypothetical protein